MGNNTWRKMIADCMAEAKDPGPLLACTLGAAELDREFYDGYGGSNGAAFTAWTPTRVYFPAVYDGAEWVASVPRDPCDESTAHVGGE